MIRRRARRAVLAAACAAVLGVSLFVALPLPRDLLDRRPVPAVRFTDRSGGLLREVASRADGRSVALPREDPVPPLVRAAFLAAEDARFDRHPGVDPLAAARAAWQLATRRRIVSGASTLTMQLARMLRPHARDLPGKLGEALWALRLEAHLSKDEILRAYLDRVWLGNGTYGIEAAAALHFGRPARTLSAGQAALLAGMTRSPAAHDPWRRPARAEARMREVLARMARLGFLSEGEARTAAAAPLDLVPAERIFEAPHLVDALVRELGPLGLDGATSVETTIDPALQRDVEEIVRTELASDPRLPNAAALVVDNATGEVLAYVGSADFLDAEREGQNDGVRALRQPGSALKPFAYGLALARGRTPASLLSDVEVHLATPTGDWVPRNYDRRVHGPVRLRAALQNSYNVPAVRLAEELGPDAILRVLRGAGFASLDAGAERYGAGVVLGNGDVTLRELAAAYRGLARGGVAGPLVEVRAARDPSGDPLPVGRPGRARRFLPAPAVALLTDVLSDEAARAPAFGLANALRLPFPVAAKTGTSRAYVDNWTAGFTVERTVVVWVGSFDGTPMRAVSGITGAGPIFGRTMVRAMRGISPAPLVDRDRFERRTVCALSGKVAGPACHGTVDEVFLPGTAPDAACPMHRQGVAGRVLDVGPEYYAWARAEGIETLAPAAASLDGEGEARILLPRDGDEFLLEAGFPGGAQEIPLRVLAPPGVGRVEIRTGVGVDDARRPLHRPPARPARPPPGGALAPRRARPRGGGELRRPRGGDVTAAALALAAALAASASAGGEIDEPRRVEVELLSKLRPRSLVVEGSGRRVAFAARGDVLLVDGRVAPAPHRLPPGAWRVSVPGAAARSYRGALSLRAAGGLLHLRATLALEAYVAAVVASETLPGTHPEALAAQAIVSRSYALAAVDRHPGAALCDLAHCQVLRGHGLPRAHLAAARDAARATAGEILRLPSGAVALAPFHAACGGHTADPGEAFGGEGSGAEATPDPGCAPARWGATIEGGALAGAVRTALARASRPGVEAVPARLRASDLVVVEGRGGFAAAVVAADGRFRLSGDAFARALDGALGWGEVRSARLALADEGDRVVVRGSGAGHGVGLCQAGAARRAAAGEDHREILARYLPGARIDLLAPRAARPPLRRRTGRSAGP